MGPSRKNNRPPYDDAEAAASRPLRLDEVEAFILDGGRLFERDKGRVVHLLHRVAATIRDHHRRYTELHDDVDRIRSRQEDRSHPMVRATEAIAALSPEEQRQLLDINYLAAVDRLEQEQATTERARLLAVNDINRVKVLVASLLSDPALPVDARGRLESLLGQINSLRSGGPASQ